MNQFLGWNECENSHTLTTATTGSKNSQKEANNQTCNQSSALCPQRSLLYRFLVLDEVKCKTHTEQSTSSTSEAETVNLTENAQSDTFKAPCCCFEYAPYTVLTIV